MESDSPNGLVTQRISDLETIDCIIHRRNVCDTHLCARQSVRTSASRFRCLWPVTALLPLSVGLPCSAQRSLSVCVINSHWVMDDRRVQEWGGIQPEPPILICFLHLVYISALTVYEQPRPWDPFHQQLLRLCRFHFFQNMSFDKVTKTAHVKWHLNIHTFCYAQLCSFSRSRTFLILAKW